MTSFALTLVLIQLICGSLGVILYNLGYLIEAGLLVGIVSGTIIYAMLIHIFNRLLEKKTKESLR